MTPSTRPNSWSLLLPWVFAERASFAFKWVHAPWLCSAGRFEEALRLHRSIPGKLRPPMLWDLSEIQYLSYLRWDHETIDAANAFLLKWQYPTAISDDRKYLLTYARWCGAIAFAHYAEGSPTPSGFEFDASTIALEKVNPRYKRRYPLTIHPAWSEDSPFYPIGRLKRRQTR
jgi:hypothetical protein